MKDVWVLCYILRFPQEQEDGEWGQAHSVAFSSELEAEKFRRLMYNPKAYSVCKVGVYKSLEDAKEQCPFLRSLGQ